MKAIREPSFISFHLLIVYAMWPWWTHPQIWAMTNISFLKLLCLRYPVRIKKSDHRTQLLTVDGLRTVLVQRSSLYSAKLHVPEYLEFLRQTILSFCFKFFSIWNVRNLGGLIWITTVNLMAISSQRREKKNILPHFNFQC